MLLPIYLRILRLYKYGCSHYLKDMPELPEVETVRLGLEQSVLGKTITKVMQNRADLRVPFPENFGERIQGSRLNSLERRGKYILAHLDNHQVVIIHLGMSGSIKIVQAGEKYDPQKHDHLVLEFNDGTICAYNDPRRFGMIMMTSNNAVNDHKSFASMGPEPLSDDFSAEVLYQALSKKKSPVKTALLDQRVVAGLGNIYVCEALYYAGIHPARIASTITIDEASVLYAKICDVLQKAIVAGGSSLKDHRQTDGQMGYFQHQFAVYDREGQSCPSEDCNCDETGVIRKLVQAGRSTFFCPRCQK